jgi:hypothetical protein
MLHPSLTTLSHDVLSLMDFAKEKESEIKGFTLLMHISKNLKTGKEYVHLRI